MNNEITACSIELQPKGKFLVKLKREDGTGQAVKGHFSMYVLDKWCEKKGLESFFQLVAKITVGMTIDEYADLVADAIRIYYKEDPCQCPWDKDRVRDELFEFFGFGSDELRKLFTHAVGRITQIVKEEPEQPEKKNMTESPLPE